MLFWYNFSFAQSIFLREKQIIKQNLLLLLSSCFLYFFLPFRFLFPPFTLIFYTPLFGQKPRTGDSFGPLYKFIVAFGTPLDFPMDYNIFLSICCIRRMQLNFYCEFERREEEV